MKNLLLRSSNKNFRVVMQGDGNFVVYDEPWVVKWTSGTNGANTVNGSVTLQGDGNPTLRAQAAVQSGVTQQRRCG